VITTGIYAPSVKIFDTSELSMKCERGLDSEVVQMQVLSQDYTKLAFLCADRNIELHAQYGKHFKIRIPKFGRDMLYQPYSCDLIAVGATNEIYRLNLDLGRFNSPLISESEEINCLDYSHELNIIATGGIDGKVEFWDMDHKNKVLGIAPNGVGADEEITALRFEGNGSLNVAIGTSKGKVLMYDMRYPLPMNTLNHHYRLPIQ
jgi:ribosome biogenesis protein ENP2